MHAAMTGWASLVSLPAQTGLPRFNFLEQTLLPLLLHVSSHMADSTTHVAAAAAAGPHAQTGPWEAVTAMLCCPHAPACWTSTSHVSPLS